MAGQGDDRRATRTAQPEPFAVLVAGGGAARWPDPQPDALRAAGAGAQAGNCAATSGA